MNLYPFGSVPVWIRTRLDPYPFGSVPVWIRTRLDPYPFGSVPVWIRTRLDPYQYKRCLAKLYSWGHQGLRNNEIRRSFFENYRNLAISRRKMGFSTLPGLGIILENDHGIRDLWDSSTLSCEKGPGQIIRTMNYCQKWPERLSSAKNCTEKGISTPYLGNRIFAFYYNRTAIHISIICHYRPIDSLELIMIHIVP